MARPFWYGYRCGALLVLLPAAAFWWRHPGVLAQDVRELALLTPDNQRVPIAAYAATPVVVNYWATWCRPCLAEFPAFEAARKRSADRVRFVMITDESPQKLRRFMARNPSYGFVFLRTATPLRLGVRPVTYFYERGLRAPRKLVGTVEEAELAAALRRLDAPE